MYSRTLLCISLTPSCSLCRAMLCAGARLHPLQQVQAQVTLSLQAGKHVFSMGLPAQALADLCGQADAQPLPREALQRAARWLSTALEARCGGHAVPAGGTAAARQLCALLRALAAVLSEVRMAFARTPRYHVAAWLMRKSWTLLSCWQPLSEIGPTAVLSEVGPMAYAARMNGVVCMSCCSIILRQCHTYLA